jgi:NADPH:quinone reductase-like Zn-dependent oxidoreductase
MKAAVIHEYSSPDEVKFEDMPDPSPRPGEVLIRTAATSINPLDVKMRSGAVNDCKFVGISYFDELTCMSTFAEAVFVGSVAETAVTVTGVGALLGAV